MKFNLLGIIALMSGFLCLLVTGDEPIEFDWVSAEVADVTTESDSPLRISVIFESPSGVVGESHDDGDLWVTSSDGFFSEVNFVEWRDVILDPDGGDDQSTRTLAIYELPAPVGGWTDDLNGEYAVMLAGGEVAKNDGTSFDLAFAGVFEVQIDERATVRPLSGEISVETFATPGAPGGNRSELAIATMTVTFPYPVDVNWGEVLMNDAGEFCVEVKGYDTGEFVPQVLTSYSRQIELGMLEPGDYAASLKSGDAELAGSEFQVAGGSSGLERGLPSDVEIELERLPTRSLYPVFAANVRLTFDHYVESVEWTEASRIGNLSASSFTAWVDPRVLIIAPMVVEYQVPLGMFLPGEYLYALSSFEGVVGSVPISVREMSGDVLPPEVTVRDAIVSAPGAAALEFSVEFSDGGELVVEGIEAQVLTAVNRMGEVFELERTSLQFTADFTAGAIARYRMEAPGGSWEASDNGRYRLFLSDPELVCDRFGNHLNDPFIGYVTVEIEREDPAPIHTTELTIVNHEVIGRWSALARLHVPEDLAVRDDWSVDWGEAQAVGPAFFLQPRFVHAGSNEEIGPIPPSDTGGAGMWVEHVFDLGPVLSGHWIVCLSSNLGHFGKDVLLAGVPNHAEQPFDSWMNWMGREEGLPEGRSFWEYCVGTDPSDPSDDHVGDPRPEVIEGDGGESHLGLRCRFASAAVDARFRFEGSSDMTDWVQLGADEIEEVERVVREDGIEEFVVCLVDDLGESEVRFLRVVAERW